jgi:hypothetical protein
VRVICGAALVTPTRTELEHHNIGRIADPYHGKTVLHVVVVLYQRVIRLETCHSSLYLLEIFGAKLFWCINSAIDISRMVL